MSPLKSVVLTLMVVSGTGCNSQLSRSDQGLSCQSISADTSWGALSGLSADPIKTERLYAVHDHNLPGMEILKIDTHDNPVKLSKHRLIHKQGRLPSYDLEGIAARKAGGFWLASEGKIGQKRPNLIVRTDDAGNVLDEIPLPPEVSRYRVKAGFEGIATIGSGNNERVAVVFQRSWKDDPRGQVKIGQYWPASERWQFYRYQLDKAKGVGLSAISFLTDGSAIVLERDNKPFFKAKFKRLYQIHLPEHVENQGSGSYPLLGKTLISDILTHYSLTCGTNGKLEGLAVKADGRIYLIADDDGKANAELLSIKPKLR